MAVKSIRLRNPGLNIIVAAVTLLTILPQFGSREAVAFEEQICDIGADTALGLEHYPAAIALHFNFLKAHPGNALAHYHLGFAYGMIGHDSQEIDEYHKAIQLGLRNWDLFLDLGLAYLERQDHSNAIGALQRSATLGPRHPEAHFDLAIAYETAGRLGDALREIVAALAPADRDIRNTKAIICAELGDLTCAQDEWNLLRQIAPDYAPARTNLEILMGFAPKIGSSSPNTGEIAQRVVESWLKRTFIRGELAVRGFKVTSFQQAPLWLGWGLSLQSDTFLRAGPLLRHAHTENRWRTRCFTPARDV